MATIGLCRYFEEAQILVNLFTRATLFNFLSPDHTYELEPALMNPYARKSQHYIEFQSRVPNFCFIVYPSNTIWTSHLIAYIL